MEREIRIDQQIIDKSKPDKFAVPQILKGIGVSREYKVNGTWTTDAPRAKPEASRIVLILKQNSKLQKMSILHGLGYKQ